MTHAYGWKPDSVDPRDHIGPLTIEHLQTAPPTELSLINEFPGVYDQGQLGSCTANAIAGILEYQQHKQSEQTSTPSRLFIYYNERAIEGTVSTDSGAEIRDGIKSINTQGACEESLWPYDVSQFAVKPTPACYTQGDEYKALEYSRPIMTNYYLKSVLAVARPFVFGFTVYESFESNQVATTGIVPYPDVSTEQVLGGHAVACTGYKLINNSLYYEIRNSWGSSWGLNGYCYMPAAMVLNNQITSDFWCLKLVS